ncbi:protein of unknown function [Taphrina deformans PYCC 5710]|uniref:Uncharacterized protein n=1 Tax=Taphrina deformans (strain PYCC 5710 / ATCC 11124 / CBS 356.35 / IMI 108563 / JCM 9778 / NBRC 8474) TaxID=1097556 RepID=R4XH84_TAPDE|nr:protein of unknown function [Taphrina deformans PYCC 5710]|eukprot:CCG82756.1 protein of unknown function [Taphrina deformans PYCC 5710]
MDTEVALRIPLLILLQTGNGMHIPRSDTQMFLANYSNRHDHAININTADDQISYRSSDAYRTSTSDSYSEVQYQVRSNMSMSLHQQVEEVFRDLLDCVVVHGGGEYVDVFGDLAASYDNMVETRPSRLSDHASALEGPWQLPRRCLTCTPSNARAFFKNRFGPQWSACAKVASAYDTSVPYSPWALTSTFYTAVEDENWIDQPIFEATIDSVQRSPILLSNIDVGSDCAPLHPNVSRPIRSTHAQRKEFLRAKVMSKLRSPYIPPKIRTKSVLRSSTSSSEDRKSGEESSAEHEVVALHSTPSKLLRRPFQKHILIPKLPDVYTNNHALQPSSDVNVDLNNVEAGVSTRVTEGFALPITPRVRKPFRRLTVVPNKQQAAVHESNAVERLVSHTHHDCLLTTLSRDHKSVEDDNTKTIIPLLFTCQMQDEADTSVQKADTVVSSEASPEVDKCSLSSSADVLATVRTKRRRIFHPPTLSTGNNRSTILNASADKIMFAMSPPYTDCQPGDVAILAQSEAQSSPLMNHQPSIGTQGELMADQGWETASGIQLNIRRDPALAAEWSLTTTSVLKKPSFEIQRRDILSTQAVPNTRYRSLRRNSARSSLERDLANRLATLQNKNLTLKKSLKTAESALKFEKAREMAKLLAAVHKWREIAQNCCEAFFIHVSRRVNEAGGVQAWHKSRKPQQWFDNDESEQAARMKEEEEEAARYGMTFEEKAAMDVGEEYFTMDLMLRDVGIPLSLIGWNTELEQWSSPAK